MGKGGELVGKSPQRIRFLKEIIKELSGPLEAVPYKMISMETLEGMRHGLYQEQQTDFTRALLEMSDDEASHMIDDLTKDTRIFTGHYKDEVYQVYLAYYGRHCTVAGDIDLPESGSYRLEVIDVWEMTRKTILTNTNGKVEFSLPGKEGIAVLAVKQ